MEAFRNPSIPAPARAARLVRRHHGLAGPADGAEPASRADDRSRPRIWRQEARDNHLRARRGKVRLDEIPTESLPVVLEVSSGRNFVILEKRNDDGTCEVRFPDDRAALVDTERLAEVYDGVCVFLRPDARSGGGRSRRFLSFRPDRSTAARLLFGTAVVSGALAYAWSGAERGEAVRPSLVVPAIGCIASGLAALGVLQLRRFFFEDAGSPRCSDLLFVFLACLAAAMLVGWAALLPVGLIVGMVLHLASSSRFGSLPSRWEEKRSSLVAAAWALAVAGAAVPATLGWIAPEAMVAASALIVYATALVSRADRLVQQWRFAAV